MVRVASDVKKSLEESSAAQTLAKGGRAFSGSVDNKLSNYPPVQSFLYGSAEQVKGVWSLISGNKYAGTTAGKLQAMELSAKR